MVRKVRLHVNGILSKEKEIENVSDEFRFSDFFNGLSTEDILFEIEFDQKIKKVKTSSYKWTDDFRYYIAGPLVTKLIQLDNGMYIQANRINGFWEIHPKKSNVLLWRINPEKSRIIAQYKGKRNYKQFENYPEDVSKNEFKLLFTKSPLEWSRSKIPFSAIACFTDHCDFDTRENLEFQRKLFKDSGIRVTKGIFLNHFSKRNDNASFENDRNELSLWVKDGHELAYHSLSQSIKPVNNSFEDFKNFTAPFPDMGTWIDHGFQPYNLSLAHKNNIEKKDFFSNLSAKGISVYWNYIDSGTSTAGVLDQLNPKHFTLRSYFRGLKKVQLKEKVALGIKNVFFHYYGNESLIDEYKSLATVIKQITLKRELKKIPVLAKSFGKTINPLAKTAVRWRTVRYSVYPVAKYNPVLFFLKEYGQNCTVFQTIEMLDLVNSLSPENIDDFNENSGFFIAHTYFSVPMSYHKGRMFINPSTINPTVTKNFNYLGELIKNKEIWNPTVSELQSYLNGIESIEFIINRDGKIEGKGNYRFRRTF